MYKINDQTQDIKAFFQIYFDLFIFRPIKEIEDNPKYYIHAFDQFKDMKTV